MQVTIQRPSNTSIQLALQEVEIVRASECQESREEKRRPGSIPLLTRVAKLLGNSTSSHLRSYSRVWLAWQQAA